MSSWADKVKSARSGCNERFTRLFVIDLAYELCYNVNENWQRGNTMTKSIAKQAPPVATAVDPATQTPVPAQPLISKRTRKTTAVISIIVVIVVLGLLIGLGYLMYTSYDRAAMRNTVPGTVRLRDMAFIVMAIESLAVILLAIIVVVLLFVVVILIHDKVIPILEQLNKSINNVVKASEKIIETTHTVRGTTTFVSEKIVSPVIEVSSYAAGIARIIKGILDLVPRQKSTVNEAGSAEPSSVEQDSVEPSSVETNTYISKSS